MEKRSFELNSLRSDKAELFASRYETLKERLKDVGAELNEFSVEYDAESTKKVLAIINEELGIEM